MKRRPKYLLAALAKSAVSSTMATGLAGATGDDTLRTAQHMTHHLSAAGSYHQRHIGMIDDFCEKIIAGFRQCYHQVLNAAGFLDSLVDLLRQEL